MSRRSGRTPTKPRRFDPEEESAKPQWDAKDSTSMATLMSLHGPLGTSSAGDWSPREIAGGIGGADSEIDSDSEEVGWTAEDERKYFRNVDSEIDSESEEIGWTAEDERKYGRAGNLYGRPRSPSPVKSSFGSPLHRAHSLRSDGPRPHIEGSVERRHKLPSLMLLSALASFGMGIYACMPTQDSTGHTQGCLLMLANLVSSASWHVVNLYMDGHPQGRAAVTLNSIDRATVAASVLYGLRVSLGGQQASWELAAMGLAVPALFAAKQLVPSHERYLRTLLHCLMHFVGVAWVIVTLTTKVAATPYDNLMAEFWPTNAHREVFNVGLLAIIAVQPVLAAVAYRATAGMPRRLAWIWY